ncbi:hypothetical protein SCLCIDRAFT_1206812 [Scleroderma citrinum Foug A]|uniref:Uncharacterized protein n=1 Tax=Scleroderma citrinum Foug A TaxID=1036808 RepID=A0A0C3EDE7_9AGAM|nr:hypothetical protein SCLCIDRAFT_1206812 [Scleroderma citrinum Foug A]
MSFVVFVAPFFGRVVLGVSASYVGLTPHFSRLFGFPSRPLRGACFSWSLPCVLLWGRIGNQQSLRPVTSVVPYIVPTTKANH